MRRRALLSGSVATLATLPAVARAQWVDCGGLVPAVVTNPGPCDPPSLDLTFMAPGSLDPRITFTRASTGTYFDSAGVMQNAAVNAPRWDYDPATLQLRGLLLEDQRSNGTFPSVVTSPSWTPGAATMTPNAAVAPDGTNAATLFVDNATSIAHTAQAVSTFAYVSGTTYTFSIYAKQATARGLQIYTGSTAFGVANYYNFDLAAGTVGSGFGVRAAIEPAGNGWYRCTLVATATASATTVTFTLCLTGNNNSAGRGTIYAGTGTGVYLWGAQAEAGDFATSYIPTTTVPVTRSIDSCLIPPASMGWFTAPGGSWFAEFDYSDSTPSNSRVIGRPDTAGGVSPLLLNATRNVAQNDGATLATANATTAGAVTKACSTWAAGSARICANGGAIATSASLATGYGAFTAAGIRFLSVGAALGTDNTSGHIRAVRYWSRVLTDAEMQALTN